MTEAALLAALDQDTATGGHRCAAAVRVVLDLHPLWDDTRLAVADVFGADVEPPSGPAPRIRARAEPRVWILPRADCDHCGRDTALHKNGRFYRHACHGGLVGPLADEPGGGGVLPRTA